MVENLKIFRKVFEIVVIEIRKLAKWDGEDAEFLCVFFHTKFFVSRAMDSIKDGVLLWYTIGFNVNYGYLRRGSCCQELRLPDY